VLADGFLLREGSMNSVVKVGLAGISGYGDLYLESLLHDSRANGVQLVGVVDPMPQRCRRLAELHERRIPIHPNLQALFARSPIDLMMIVTPIHLHAPQTCFSLKQGANVLCEKPLAGTMHDALKMVEASRAAKGFAAIGYQWSFSAAVQALKREIMSGSFGRPVRMKTIVYFPRALSYFRRNDWVGRIHTADGAGVLDSPVNNATSHFLHNMFYLLGSSRQTSAMPATVQAELYRANEIENYDTAAIRAVTDCGTEILFYTTHCVQDRMGPIMRFEFERAVVEFDAAKSAQFVARFRDGREKSFGQPNLDRHEKIWQSIDSVRSGRPVACDVNAAMAHTSCVMAAQKSADILDFPLRLRQTIELEGEPMLCVDGLYEALIDCYEQGVLPAATGKCDWARAGSAIELEKAPPPAPRTAAVPLHA
jgi:predicted dehydrogenase